MSYSKQIWDTTSYVNPTRMNHIEDGIKGVSDAVDNLSASDVAYNNSQSGLSATKVQGAIDEVNNKIPRVGGVTATKGSKIGAFYYVASKYANILKVAGYFECNAALTANDVICSFTGISNTRRAYTIAGKTDASKLITISVPQGSLSIVVDTTPAQSTNVGDLFVFDMVIICD